MHTDYQPTNINFQFIVPLVARRFLVYVLRCRIVFFVVLSCVGVFKVFKILVLAGVKAEVANEK